MLNSLKTGKCSQTLRLLPEESDSSSIDTMNLKKTKNNILSANKELKVDKTVFVNIAFAFLFKQRHYSKKPNKAATINIF